MKMIERVYAAGLENSGGVGCAICIMGHGGLTYGAAGA